MFTFHTNTEVVVVVFNNSDYNLEGEDAGEVSMHLLYALMSLLATNMSTFDFNYSFCVYLIHLKAI